MHHSCFCFCFFVFFFSYYVYLWNNTTTLNILVEPDSLFDRGSYLFCLFVCLFYYFLLFVCLLVFQVRPKVPVIDVCTDTGSKKKNVLKFKCTVGRITPVEPLQLNWYINGQHYPKIPILSHGNDDGTTMIQSYLNHTYMDEMTVWCKVTWNYTTTRTARATFVYGVYTTIQHINLFWQQLDV